MRGEEALQLLPFAVTHVHQAFIEAVATMKALYPRTDARLIANALVLPPNTAKVAPFVDFVVDLGSRGRRYGITFFTDDSFGK